MTGPEVRLFPLVDGSGRVRAEVCPVTGLGLTWETFGADGDLMAIGPHYVPLWLVAALGPQFAELVTWCGERGCSVATDVRQDKAREAARMRRADAVGWRADDEAW